MQGQGESAALSENMSFVQRKKFFEKEIEEHKKPPQTQKQKACSMTQQELLTYVTGQEADSDQPEYDKVLLSSQAPQNNFNSSHGQVRTVKAEKRLQERLKQSGAPPIVDGERVISLADERALQAEKRAAWRKARMKSLEDDALRAQAVISKAQERMSVEDAKVKANTISAVDIAFADDEDDVSGRQNGQNGSQLEVTKQQIIELSLEDKQSLSQKPFLSDRH